MFKITIEDVTPSLYESHIIDSKGDVVRILYKAGSRREYVPYADLPQDLINAIIAVEDKRFYKHHGIDFKGIVRSMACIVLSFGRRIEGGSTITQQLIKNQMFSGWVNGESFFHKVKRKIPEQILALKLEKLLTKEEILERYLNAIYFGGGCYGVQAASKHIFNKPVKDLSLPECILLGRLPNHPNSNNPLLNPERASKTKNKVAQRMLDQGYISDEEYQQVLNTDFTEQMRRRAEELKKEEKCFSYHEDSLLTGLSHDLMNKKNMTHHEVYELLYSGGVTITSTQNTSIQNACDELFAEEGIAPDSKIEAAMLLMDPATGEVLAEEGGLGRKNASLILSRAVDAMRNADCLPVQRYFLRTTFVTEKNTVSLKDLCLAYCYYASGLENRNLRYYKKVNGINGDVLLEEEKSGLSPDPSRYPLPGLIELPLDTDIWVIGKAGRYILGVWCGYDDNTKIPPEKEYYTFGRKLWDRIERYCKEQQDEE